MSSVMDWCRCRRVLCNSCVGRQLLQTILRCNDTLSKLVARGSPNVDMFAW